MKTKSQKESLEIKLPELGEGVTEGELVKWLVAEGDLLNIDRPVAEVMTDKASMEVPSPFNGVVESFLVKEGESIQVGQSILTMKSQPMDPPTKAETKDKNPPAEEIKKEDSRPALKDPEKPFSAPALTADSDAEDPSILATPFTRRLARELHVSLSKVQGSGLAGRITKQDVLKHSKTGSYLEQKPLTQEEPKGFAIPVKDHQERKPLKGVRKKNCRKKCKLLKK